MLYVKILNVDKEIIVRDEVEGGKKNGKWWKQSRLDLKNVDLKKVIPTMSNRFQPLKFLGWTQVGRSWTWLDIDWTWLEKIIDLHRPILNPMNIK